MKRGFEFTLMVCGESGLGKSTLVNSLFCADIYSADYPGPSQRAAQKTVQVETTKVVLQVNKHSAIIILPAIVNYIRRMTFCGDSDLPVSASGSLDVINVILL